MSASAQPLRHAARSQQIQIAGAKKAPKGSFAARLHSFPLRRPSKGRGQRGKRRDIDGDRQIRPDQPDACHSGQFDVAEPHSLAPAQFPITGAKSEKRRGHEARAQESMEDRLFRRGGSVRPAVAESGDESERIQFVWDDQPAAVDDCNREGQRG